MKLIASLCAIVAVASAGEPELFKLSQESLDRMHKISTPCAQEFNVNPSYVHNLGDVLPRDEATNKFLHCFAVKSGIVDKDGHMVFDRLAGIVGQHPLLNEIKEATRKCNDITKEDPVATTVAMHICYGESFPIRFVF